MRDSVTPSSQVNYRNFVCNKGFFMTVLRPKLFQPYKCFFPTYNILYTRFTLLLVLYSFSLSNISWNQYCIICPPTFLKGNSIPYSTVPYPVERTFSHIYARCVFKVMTPSDNFNSKERIHFVK